ncbi:MAG: N-formylglutamate amidohydrolase [Hyphomicrobiales bacterium]
MADAAGTGDFEIRAPKAWTAPAIFNSPHSGHVYPPGFLRQTRLAPHTLRKSEDCYIDRLFAGCLLHGAPLLIAHVPRSYVDLNREPYELDPRMFEDELPGYVNAASPRVAGGLGTIPRVVAEGEDIYRGRLPIAEALSRIERIYRPYHRTLSALIEEVFAKNGSVLLVDCHSMPSSAANHVVPAAVPQVDVVLGDRFGASCSEEVTGYLEELLRARGLRVLRNKPYAGGFITRSHGAPRTGRHALQIEINRALYLDEATLETSQGFEPLRQTLTAVSGDLLGALASLIGPRKLAAE